MPKLGGILETAIHTEDMARSRAFYEGVLGLEPIYSDDRLSAYAVAGRDVLLVFRKGTTGQDRYPAQRDYSRPWRRWCVACGVCRRQGRTRSLGDASCFARGCHRRAQRLVPRRPQHLFPRPRRAPSGTRNTGIVVGVLGCCPQPSLQYFRRFYPKAVIDRRRMRT